MPDLYTWLTARYIEEHRAGARPAASDAALQWMELELEASEKTGAGERYLLEAYLALTNEELQTLPPPVHEWFLERWALAGPGASDPERTAQLAERIAAIYLIGGTGLHQAAAVSALLTFDWQREQAPSYVLHIWDLVLRTLPPADQAAILAPLIETLLDLVYLKAENRAALQALAALVRRDLRTRYALPLLRERVNLVGEDPQGPVARLLEEFERPQEA